MKRVFTVELPSGASEQQAAAIGKSVQAKLAEQGVEAAVIVLCHGACLREIECPSPSAAS